MKNRYYFFAILAFISAHCLDAVSIEIENFDNYTNTDELHEDVFSFGSAAQAGKPNLVVGSGDRNTNAAEFVLTWDSGNNANLILYNLSSISDTLIDYENLSLSIFMEVPEGFSAPADSSLVKLVIEGGANNSVWQTRSEKAVPLETGTFNSVVFENDER